MTDGPVACISEPLPPRVVPVQMTKIAASYELLSKSSTSIIEPT